SMALPSGSNREGRNRCCSFSPSRLSPSSDGCSATHRMSPGGKAVQQCGQVIRGRSGEAAMAFLVLMAMGMSVVNGRLSVVSRQWSAVGGRRSVVGSRMSEVDYYALRSLWSVRHSQLTTDH